MKRYLKLAVAGVTPLFWMSTAFALENCAGVEIGTPGLHCGANSNPIYAFLEFIINWVIRLLGAVAVLIIVSSPIFMVMSGGNPAGVKKAKDRLVNAVVGLILLSLAFTILKLIGIVQ